ncbi:protein lin-37 homolog [Anneissia japonica]|uniref:protein lin-37 homolog n=1 Tax=Anneissia japonica TaxID=1529436 RepID=UPI0014258030|nr:protein lin-37 homolog [Anneissia japonica]XP_033105628.1 protein lin-37 homolog [Anneissia japonica]XP_033105629.1 protein lin-37 homolog [Anneissia japonica]
MSVEIKQEVLNSPDVTVARSRLDGVLQTLVDQADEGDPSEDELSKSPQDIKSEGSSVSTSPPKKLSARSRKRKKKELSSNAEFDTSLVEGMHLKHTYIMKLFDRSLDLAQFESTTPLYPVCRDWMNNQPHSKRPTRTRTPSPEPLPDSDQETPLKDIYKMPPPLSPKKVSPDERDPRIPSPVPQPDEALDINMDPEQAPPGEVLLQNHLQRWRQIRTKWKETTQADYARYSEGYALLKAMYERQ